MSVGLAIHLESLHNHMRTELLQKKNSSIAARYDRAAFANGTVTTFDQFSEIVSKYDLQHWSKKP
jgi:hypothetical protein